MDRAHFTMHGAINIHNCRISYAFTKENLYSPVISVWCSCAASMIVGSPFFSFFFLFFFLIKEHCLKDCSITAECYLKMLKEELLSSLLYHNILDKMAFRQDGSPPHIANKVMKFLIETFSKK